MTASPTRLVEDTRTSGTSFNARLQPGREYRWNIRACNAAGCSEFTRPLYFRTPAAAPPPPPPPRPGPSAPARPSVPQDTSPGQASSPGPIMDSDRVRLDWDSVSGADEYDLGVRDLTTNQLVVDRRVDSSAYSARLEPGRAYRWNVRACNASGCSDFTRPLYFRTPAR